jgi:hypothetical protein
MLSIQQNQRTRGRNRFCLEVEGAVVAQTMYILVSKCKDKTKQNKKP